MGSMLESLLAIAIFAAVIPGVSFAVSRFCPRVVFLFSLSLLGFGLLSFLTPPVLSGLGYGNRFLDGFPALQSLFDPVLLVGGGFVFILTGMSALAGFGIWKARTRI
jgi:hypothetical protein